MTLDNARPPQRWTCLLPAVAVIACSSRDAPISGEGATKDADILVPAGVDTLPETAKLYVSQVRGAYVGPGSSVMISDAVARRVLVFRRHATEAGVIGRGGNGPGEFNAPYAITRWGTDTVGVADPMNMSVSLFGANGDRFLRRLPVPGLPTSISGSGGVLFIAAYSAASRTAVASWHAGVDTLRRWLSLPISVTRNSLAMQAYPLDFIASRADTVAVGFASSSEILVAVDGRPPSDRFVLPARNRRAIPARLDEVLGRVLATPARLTLIPSLDGLYWRPDGLLLVWHKDWIAPPGGLTDFTHGATQATLHAYVSVVDRRRRMACVDIPVPTAWAENPALTASQDKFFVVGHAVGVGDKPVLEVRRYRFGLNKCEWMGLKQE